MKDKLKPAAGYIRMSTDKQEDSPEQQRMEILKLAQREGYRIIRWYEDLGISGAKTHKRPKFRQMIRDAEERGDFRAILCWDQDRFGRFDSIEAGEWISPLRRAGVELVTVCQGRIDWDDFAGRLVYQITQEGKHRFLVDLSRNSLRGMIRFAKAGHLLGMATPYGYDRQYFNASGEKICRIKRGERFHKPRDWTAKLVPASNRQAEEEEALDERAAFVALVAADEKGSRIFQDEDVLWLSTTPYMMPLVESLYWAGRYFNGLTEENRQAWRKNSKGTGDGGSPSSCAAPSTLANALLNLPAVGAADKSLATLTGKSGL